MKKFLAIILSIMMVLGACGVASFAFYEEDLPTMPGQTEGRIYFAADNVYVEAGQTYDVPVYMISDVDTEITEGFVELGFEFYLAGNASATVNSVEFASGIKAVDGFCALESYYGYTEDEIANEETYHQSSTTGYVAFGAGLAALKQAKVQVATVNVTIGEDFAGEDAYVTLNFTGYNFSEAPYGYYFYDEDAIEIYNGGIFAGEPDYDSCEALTPDVILMEATTEGGDIYFSFGYMVEHHEPPVPTWKDRLIDWFQDTVEGILQVFETIHEYIRVVIGLLDKIK